ncbi:MAG: Tn3 family transposase, partial [Clostridia bacterium]
QHKLAHAVFYGKQGIHAASAPGSQDHLAALRIVMNAIVVWNTRYMAEALEALRRDGDPMPGADGASLSPVRSEHIQLVGQYAFEVPTIVAHGGLRPLGDRS